MFRTILSLVALAALFAALPSTIAASQSAPAARAGKPAATATVVNINTAPAADIERLPGIGAKTAARIVEYREKNGPFKKVEDILETSRSGPVLLSLSFGGASRPVSRSRRKPQEISA